MSRYHIETLYSICNELGYLFQMNKPNSDGVGETIVKTKVNNYSVWSHNADWACKKLLDKIIEVRDGRIWVKEDKRRNKPKDVEVVSKGLCGGKTTVMITSDYKYIYIQRDGLPWNDASEAKSIIQALQKCVDWLESKWCAT